MLVTRQLGHDLVRKTESQLAATDGEFVQIGRKVALPCFR